METIAENIDKLCNSDRKKIIAHYYSIDESNLWPVCGKFNATTRALFRLRKYEKESGNKLSGLELCLFLENQISDIVNHIN